jgi:hypothetical protein
MNKGPKFEKGEIVEFTYWDDVPRIGEFLEEIPPRKEGDPVIAFCRSECFQYKMPIDRVKKLK